MNTFKSKLKMKRDSATGTLIKLMSTATLVLLTGISNVNAGPLDLVDTPLFLQGSAPPAIAISMDTSPGMRNAYIFVVDGLEANNGGLPNSKSFVSAPRVNVLYYNPDVTYKYPLNVDGSEFGTVGGQTTFAGAWVDGYDHTEGKVNLNTQYKVISKYNGGSGSTCYDDGTTSCNGNSGANRAYYKRYTAPDPEVFPNSLLDNNNYTVVPVTIAEEQNFAIWFSYYKTRNMLVKSAATRAFGVLDDDFKLAWQSFKSNTAFEVDMYPLNYNNFAHKQAFWDWLLNLKANGPDKLIPSTYEAGHLFQKAQTYREGGVGDLMTCQQNFHVLLVNSKANGAGNSTVNFQDSSAIKVPFGNTSGVPYSGTGESAIYKDEEEDDSFADVAFNFWAQDLMPNLKNGVPRYLSSFQKADGSGEVTLGVGQDPWDAADLSNTAAKTIFWNDKNNPANWQNMVNFVIGLGMVGRLNKRETNVNVSNPLSDYDKLRANTLQWDSGLPGNNKIKFSDDLWHGAVNSRGDYIQATTPDELVAAFLSLLEQLKTRLTGSSSASTVSANIVTEDTKVYKTGFDAIDWSGTVVAQQINLDGTIGVPLWDAACKLTGGPCGSLGGIDVTATRNYTNRRIFSYDKITGDTRAFKASSLTTNQTAALNQSVFIQNNTATLEDLVNYLRGERANEEKNGGVFRSRRVLLGDVIHSSAKVVRGPSESYIDDAFPSDSNIVTAGDGHKYTDFKVDHADRQNVLLVGANDGMLHAFDAENGDELWAFIPSQSLANMHLLANPIYGHQNFVDSSPTIRDIYVDDEWKTVAVGGLRLGGQGYYALDITDPLNPEVLWEFTDADNDEMGYSYGEPFVTRLKNDKWVALLPNGYNNIVNDGHVGSGISTLFMVDMEDGSLIKSFETTNGDVVQTNGMASAAVSDIPYDITGDTVFVGDLRGDVYRIDLTDSSYPMDLMVASIDPYKTHITTPLRLTQYQNFSNSPDDIMVHIGTGKFIENSDRSSASVDPQYVAGIFDRGAGDSEYPINLASDPRIVEQSVLTQNDTTGVRTISSLPVTKGAHLGWRMELPDTGERIIAKMATRASAHFLIYSSYLPKGGSACSTGGASWVMVVDNRTGGQPTSGSILRGGTVDGVFVENQVFGVTPIGFAGGGGEILIISTDSDVTGGGDSAIVIPDFTWRRRSWHRMFQDN